MVRRRPIFVRARIAQGVVNPQGLAPGGSTVDIKVASVMDVKLLGNPDEFSIDRRSSDVQIVDTSGTDWAWEVTPLTTGKHELTLVATAKSDGLTRDVVLYREDIVVTVTVWQWIADARRVLEVGRAPHRARLPRRLVGQAHVLSIGEIGAS